MLPEASYLAAFLGGLFSLLSPCSALLLPAFFAYAFESRRELVGRTVVFYLGLCVTLVPLGMGISAVSRLFYGQRGTLILAAGVLLILLGVWQLLGRGFSLGPFEGLRGRVRGDSAGSTFALGAVYGFAGFCSGPILGAVLTVAAASGETLRGAGLLATYALGMAAPLFGLALLWDRLDLGRRRWLRGRELSLGGLRVHTTNLVSGAMFVLLGVMFIAYEGTTALTGFYASRGAEDLALAAQGWAGSAARAVPDALVLALLAALAVSLLAYRRLAGKKKGPEDDPGPDAPRRG
ncbi:cytochrome c biogenesis protein CcdA [Rubrobacter marinus]|uniref:Cytochrome c biogenesis protein CcdA n=1 Tax=Rubrobacter marinus TaxID=2653852 RepID=A0A6G8PU47_9ACTN|nr:cytochrome c biogenesis CcdA family protein [Rubrobacter marinus]QIN77612.1 cytochrome c biogenesis protein CcdA [Rubrobacter marinus]